MTLLKKELRFAVNMSWLSLGLLYVSLIGFWLMVAFGELWPSPLMMGLILVAGVSLFGGLLLSFAQLDGRGARNRVIKPHGPLNVALRWGAFFVLRYVVIELDEAFFWLIGIIFTLTMALSTWLTWRFVKNIQGLDDATIWQDFRDFYDDENPQKVDTALKHNRYLKRLTWAFFIYLFVRFEVAWGVVYQLPWLMGLFYAGWTFYVVRLFKQLEREGCYEATPVLKSLQYWVFSISLMLALVLEVQTTLLDDVWSRGLIAVLMFSVPLWQFNQNQRAVDMTRYAPLLEGEPSSV